LQNTLGLYEVEPHPNPWPLAHTLGEVVKVLAGGVTMASAQIVIVLLWIACTYGVRSLASGVPGPFIFPRLLILSAAKRCGKSTLMGIIAHLVARALSCDSITRAALFRITGIDPPPVLFIDEFDVVRRHMPEVEKLLNSGYKRDGRVILTAETKRKSVKGHEVVGFPTFAPCVAAGIGDVGDTLSDRSIRVTLVRKQTSGPTRSSYRQQDLAQIQSTITPHLAAHADAMAQAMAAGVPRVDLAALGLDSDRALDNAEPLYAVARLAGGKWPALFEQAIRQIYGTKPSLSGNEKALDDIWKAIREVRVEHCRNAREHKYMARKGGKYPGPVTFISSFDLAIRLADMPDSFVAHLTHDQQIKNKVATTLRKFAIEPVQQRQRDGEKARGYHVGAIRAAHRQYGRG